jgi:hypothetical protein
MSTQKKLFLVVCFVGGFLAGAAVTNWLISLV